MLKALMAILLQLSGPLPEVEPTDDLVITKSVRIKPGEYRIEDKGKPGILRIEGDHIAVVLDGVTIHGTTKKGQMPDSFKGTGLVVTGNNNVIHGGGLHGFKVAVELAGGEGHWLMGMDVGGNFAQRLKSTPQAEVSGDWLRPHRNDDGEWAKNYGAGIWVRGTKGVRILACVGHRSQNGILLDRTENAVVRSCDFSFNSGWGIALWRASGNVIENNSFNWCVRGYSHDVYARGQDSAGILVFEQCHRNVFRGNSATHGGDGFFLYAGHETTKKTGEGGCNDNLVEENDFSHAVANGIEATFSTGNRFLKNRLDDCNYGVWAGYSRKSVFAGNVIRNCTFAGIAIEHGSENEIRGNLIENSRRGVSLWWDEDKEFLESVYGKKNRTDSADTVVDGNIFRGGDAALHLVETSRISFVGNLVDGVERAVTTEGTCGDVTVMAVKDPPDLELPDLEVPPDARRGRKYIYVHEWGPYDFNSPLLHPSRMEGRRTARFRVLGARGLVVVRDVTGDVEVGSRQDKEGRLWLTVKPKSGAGTYEPFSFTVDVGGVELEGGGVLLSLWWKVRFWKWKTDPREDAAAWQALLATESPIEKRVRAIDFTWATGGPGGVVGVDQFATVAETEFELSPGEYEIVTLSDDGVRVVLDDKVVIENWTHHGPTEDRAAVTITKGTHRLRVEHFELAGYARLSVRIRKR